MRFILPVILLVPGYWFAIQGQGFGGLWGLLLLPVALVIALAAGTMIRRKFQIDAKLHRVDFIEGWICFGNRILFNSSDILKSIPLPFIKLAHHNNPGEQYAIGSFFIEFGGQGS